MPTSLLQRRHMFFAMSLSASFFLFWGPLYQLAFLSLDDARYSHIILIPVISAFVIYPERDKIFSRIMFRPTVAVPFLIAALGIYALLALRAVHPSFNYALSTITLAMVLVWAAGFAVCYGGQAFAAAIFPILFLLLMVPVPFDAMDKVISALQWGSAEATYLLFKLAGVPVFRDGVSFELPDVGIEIAKECSSIHSGWALFITGLLVGHMCLKTVWTKLWLSLSTVPIAMLTNAVRIVTIWFLGTKVNMGFFYGNLHRNGGILFSLISLSILVSFLYLLRKMERTSNRTRSADEASFEIAEQPGSHAATLP